MMLNFLFKQKYIDNKWQTSILNGESVFVNIKRVRESLNENEFDQFETNIFFENDVQVLTNSFNSHCRNNSENIKRTSLRQLFSEFIMFYMLKQNVSLNKEYNNEHAHIEKCLLNIEDPIDLHHNPGQKT